MLTRRLLAVLILALAAVTAIAQSRVTVGFGHSGAVRALAGRADLDIAFSVGDDGKLLVWDLVRGGIRTSYQLAHNPITKIAVHPDQPRLTLYVSDGLTSGRLIGFNWETGTELFSVKIDAVPEYLGYSPQGTYLVYTVPSFDSITFLDSQTGVDRNYFNNGFGIVSFVQMARSERNVMTYVPSRGEFIYWQIQSGNELQTVSTVSRLTNLTVVDIDTQRYLAASDGDRLVVIDNLSGEVAASYPLRPISGITYDSVGGRILVLSQQNGENTLLAFTFADGQLRRDFYRAQDASARTSRVVAVGSTRRGFLGGSTDGEVAFYDSRTGAQTLLGPALTSHITSIAITPGALSISLGDHILSFVSDLFDPTNRDMSMNYLRTTTVPVSGLAPLSIVSDAGRLLVWGDGEPGSLWEVRPPSVTATLLYQDEMNVPIARVTATSEGPLLIMRDGRIVQVDETSGQPKFTFTAVGVQDATWGQEVGLVAAKTRSTAFDSSLIIVDQSTQETVAAETDAYLTTRVAIDPRTRTLYAIGLLGSQSEPRTTLTEISGRGFSSTNTLESVDEELSNGDIVWDPVSQALFSTLDLETVRRYVNRRETVLESVPHLHGGIAVSGSIVASTNLDGTASIWNGQTGEHLVDLYIEGNEWIAITKEGEFLESSRAAERYLTFLPGERTRLTLSDFRITLPIAP